MIRKLASTTKRGTTPRALVCAFTLFAAHAPDVHAQGRGRPPQSLDDWKIENAAPDGKVALTGRNHDGYYRAYVCPRFDLAEAVVAAIPERGGPGTTVQGQDAAMAAALRQNKCKPTRGTYQVSGVGHEVEIDRGPEAQEYWTALAARDASGRVIGLVFDSSPFAMTD